MMMMKNQNTQEASLTTTRLSPLAKPFTFNRSSSTSPFLSDASHSHFDVAAGGFGYGKQGLDSLESLFAIGNDVVATSVADTTIFHKGTHAVDGSNPRLTESDGVFKKGTGTNVAEDIPSNSKGTSHAADESGSFPISNCKVAPLKLSTTDMSSAKNTPQNQSSKNLGESDSDVDSPCWKGTMAFCQSQTPIEISGSLKTHNVEKAIEKQNSLNPLAPQFFPGIGYIKDDYGSSNSCVPVATNLLSGEDVLMNTVMAESPAELNKEIELLHSGNTCGTENAFNMLNDPKSSSVDLSLNLPCMMMQSEGSLTSEGKLETIVDVDNFIKGTKDPRVSRSISEAFPIKGRSQISFPTPTTSSSEVSVVTDLLKMFEGVSKSLIESPRPDVGTMVNAMHVLSELLVHTSMDGVDSYDEHGRDVIMVQQIINNLNDFSTKKCGPKIPTLEPTPVNSSFCLDRSLDLRKGLELTSVKPLNIQHQLRPQNDQMVESRVIKMVGQHGQSFLASSGDEDQYKGYEIDELQVIRRSLGKTLDFNKQMHPEALVFWNLWLDSEAERCYRKYKTYHCLVKSGVDVNSANVAELLR